MATSSNAFPFFSGTDMPATGTHEHGHRRVDRRARRSLHMLADVIEYLTEEHMHEEACQAANPRLEAIRLLMALHRNVYLAYPETPTLWQRVCAFLHPR